MTLTLTSVVMPFYHLDSLPANMKLSSQNSVLYYIHNHFMSFLQLFYETPWVCQHHTFANIYLLCLRHFPFYLTYFQLYTALYPHFHGTQLNPEDSGALNC